MKNELNHNVLTKKEVRRYVAKVLFLKIALIGFAIATLFFISTLDSKVLAVVSYLCGFSFCIWLLIVLPSMDDIAVLKPDEIAELSDVVAENDELRQLFNQAIADDKRLRHRDWLYVRSVMTPIENDQLIRYAKRRLNGEC